MFLHLVFNQLKSLTMEKTDILNQDLWHPQTLTADIYLSGFNIWLASSLWLLAIITTKTFFYFLYWELFASTDITATSMQPSVPTLHYVVEKQQFSLTLKALQWVKMKFKRSGWSLVYYPRKKTLQWTEQSVVLVRRWGWHRLKCDKVCYCPQYLEWVMVDKSDVSKRIT